MARAPEQRGDVDNGLLRRAEAAVEAAERIRARSEVVVGLSAALREAGMTTRCAWCSRYRLGGRWVLAAEAPTFLGFAQVSHGICEDCVVELRAAGLSA